MEAEEREQLQKQSAVLRQELKVWEREFAAANGGRKARRDDIKQHPSIGMVKGYHRLSNTNIRNSSSEVQRLQSKP
jgi:hypothetical protein